jgi:hypothetical protein
MRIVIFQEPLFSKVLWISKFGKVFFGFILLPF